MQKFFFVALLLACSATRAVRADVSFENISFDDACKKAASEHKSVMVDFYTDWCYWCKVLDQKTYSSEDVPGYAGKHFIAVKVNAEKGDGIALAQKSNVHGYPTIVFFDETGAESYRVVGYQPPDKFVLSMNVAGMGSESTLAARLQSHPDDANAAYALAERYNAANDHTQAKEYYQRVVAIDSTNKLGLAEKASLTLAYDALNNGKTDGMESYITKFPSSGELPEVHKTLALVYLKMQDVGRSQKHFDVIRNASPKDPELLNGYAWECATDKLNLDNAITYAQSAVALAKDPPQKASFMDTQAEVLYAQKKFQAAVNVEREALTLLTRDQKFDRLRTDMQKQLKKFQEAMMQ